MNEGNLTQRREDAKGEPRWKRFDVAFGDNLQRPRRLILEWNPKYGTYTTCSEHDGIGHLSESSLRSREEWLTWIDRFSDDLTGRQLREAKEAVLAEFIEPKSWALFRERFAETGDLWIREKISAGGAAPVQASARADGCDRGGASATPAVSSLQTSEKEAA